LGNSIDADIPINARLNLVWKIGSRRLRKHKEIPLANNTLDPPKKHKEAFSDAQLINAVLLTGGVEVSSEGWT
jgi:hypothetical protein